MDFVLFISLFYLLVAILHLNLCSAVDIIQPNQAITDGETIVSSGQRFELGFFSPPGSISRYLGIWYKRSPDTVVWIANRENPVTGSNGILAFSSDGNLVILNSTNGIIWSSNCPKPGQDSIAQLLKSGNLVLIRKKDMYGSSYLWQSFDFPTDTLLPGMKMGWNLSSQLSRYLSSWKSENDPAPGDFTYGIEYLGTPQLMLRKGTKKMYRSGAWNVQRSQSSGLLANQGYRYNFVWNNEELYFMYEISGNAIISRLTLNQSGLIQLSVQNEGDTDWINVFTVQYDLCDMYGQCGPNGICRISKIPICECLEGFIPISQREWDGLIWTSGCIRRTPTNCEKGDWFRRLGNVKLPDLKLWLNKSMSLKDCRRECLKNCSCMAFASSDIRRDDRTCFIWFGNLTDLRELDKKDSEQDIYFRMAASEQDQIKKKNRQVMIAVLSTASGMLFLGSSAWCALHKRKKRRDSMTIENEIDLPLFDMATIATATNKFSGNNMIGEGGFGPVYKGRLSSGQEVAVKRLSQSSRQGLQEFKSEVDLIAKLQHRNLVRLLGCCVEGEERMLIYEYMPNKSLDYFIFEESRKELLTWENRFEISMGISRGLLYLHQDSRLRIVHRDLKTSNILLDSDLNARISDFGLARSVGGDQYEGKTRRVIGTFGYMSPEYAADGKFSMKSDVFSLGVLLLEIVSGAKNRKFSHPNHHHNLLGHAWLLWNEGKAIEIIDECLKQSYDESQVLRCIHVALLCVQKLPEDRPTMASVVFMLGNVGVTLPQPKKPGFFVERSSNETDVPLDGSCLSENSMTVTMLAAR